MIAAILDVATLGKVILYSLIAGVGISAVFAIGVSSAAGLVDAIRARRTWGTVLWGASTGLCLGGALAGIVLGVVVMASK